MDNKVDCDETGFSVGFFHGDQCVRDSGIVPQLKAALHITQTQSEYLVTTPSFAVMIFVVLSPLRSLGSTFR